MMDREKQNMWVDKAILSIKETLPSDNVVFQYWQFYERLLFNDLVCAEWITKLQINNTEVGYLYEQSFGDGIETFQPLIMNSF